MKDSELCTLLQTLTDKVMELLGDHVRFRAMVFNHKLTSCANTQKRKKNGLVPDLFNVYLFSTYYLFGD